MVLIFFTIGKVGYVADTNVTIIGIAIGFNTLKVK